jgi:flagellar protein FlaG
VALARAGAPKGDVAVISLPPSPPAEVLDEVARARDRAAELAANNRELHFTTDQDTGRVIVQVRDLQGNVIRTIPPSHALQVVSGAPI